MCYMYVENNLLYLIIIYISLSSQASTKALCCHCQKYHKATFGSVFWSLTSVSCFLLTCCFLALRDCSSSDACCFSVSFKSASVKFTCDTFCTNTWMYFLSYHMLHVRRVYKHVGLILQGQFTQKET